MTSTDKPTRLLRVGQLRARYSVSEKTIDRWHKGGILPPPIRMKNGVRFWREADIEQVERERLSPRHHQPDSAA
jgi:predicted DNA-binding transcriptional regulator AlpA